MTEWPETVVLVAITQGPLVIGLGTAAPVETGIALHHTYGVPFLPGSALKGLARRAALDFDLKPAEVDVIFGTDDVTERATGGYVTFWDAWLDPDETGVVDPDVVTVHHPRYYATEGVEAPSDFDDPIPLPFLAIASGKTFHVALSAPQAPDWLEGATAVLRHGLATYGLGGKTAIGYGRMSIDWALGSPA